MSLYAAERYGARVTGVTIAADQKRFVDARIADRGLADRVGIEPLEYRDVMGTYDAVSSVAMGEHVGERTTRRTSGPCTAPYSRAVPCSCSRCRDRAGGRSTRSSPFAPEPPTARRPRTC